MRLGRGGKKLARSASFLVVLKWEGLEFAAGGFAFGFAEEFFGLDFVAEAGDGGDVVVFVEEVDEGAKVFVVHDDDGAVVVGHEVELHVFGVLEEVFLGHLFGDFHGLDLFQDGFLFGEEGVEGEAFSEAEFVFVLDFAGFFFGDDLGLVVVLEEGFEFRLVEDDDVFVDDGDLVVGRHFEGDFGGEGVEAFAVDFPGVVADEGGGGGDGFRDVEGLHAVVATWVGEFHDDAFDLFEADFGFGVVVDVFVFVLDDVDEGFGAADAFEFGVIDDVFFAVGFFVFTGLEALFGAIGDEFDGGEHEHVFDAVRELFVVADFVGGVVFVEEEKFGGYVVFVFFDFVGPAKDVAAV